MDMSVTVGEVKLLCEQMAELKAEVDQHKDKLKKLNSEFSEREQKLLAYLETEELDQFRTKEGLFSVRRRSSVKVPGDPDNREKFFSHLKDKGIFENMITVHSQTLNAWYKSEQENAQERGEMLTVPGIDMPTVHEQIVFRRS
jgi:hypothetical protein